MCGMKVLIIDGDKFFSDLLADKLKRQGIDVVKLDDGEGAVELLKKEKPALITLGSTLAGKLSGLDTLKAVRKADGKVTVIALADSEKEEDAAAGLAAGATQYLVKGFYSIEQILGIIQKYVGVAAAIKKPPVKQAKKEEKEEEGGTKKKDKEDKMYEKGLEGYSAVRFEQSQKLKAKVEKELVSSYEVSIVDLVDDLIEFSFLERASDIHIDPFENKIVVRLRVDGVLHDTFELPKHIQLEVITRIKVLAGLRTDEHQVAQDGRFKVKVDLGFIDIRVSIAPTYYGENCVMRILSEKSEGGLSLESIGFSEHDMERVAKAIGRPYGMILATGPTGSGKTTTLYSILKQLNTKEVSIITIEDPIEYSVGGIDQVQVNERTGLTFAHGLRFILRQDPNIIMVGEIRDNETASIAVNAAMTGHLLLSTLHANDAATSLPRLLDMGVEPFLIGSTVNIVIGQRLVRTICTDCKTEKVLTDAELESLKLIIDVKLLNNNRKFFTGKGCNKCDGTGFRGRIGIHEILTMSEKIRDLIMKHATAADIKAAAIEEGMVTMLQDGLIKATKGISTIEEVLRVFHE